MSTAGFEQDVCRDGDLMTVGEPSRRTGLSIKAIRRYEALGLIYSARRRATTAYSTSAPSGAPR